MSYVEITSAAKLECERNTRKERDSYLFRVRKLDMEIPPDSLEAGGVKDLEMTSLPVPALAGGDAHRCVLWQVRWPTGGGLPA